MKTTALKIVQNIRSEIRYTFLLPLLFMYLLFSCNQKETTKPMFSLINDSGINFQNTVVDSKQDNSFYFRNYYNGGGVAVGDINNDGFCDVLLTSNMGENKLYLNKGGFKFEDVTAKSG